MICKYATVLAIAWVFLATGSEAADISAGSEFQRYCALCHGPDGRGVGFITEGDRTRKAADLTQIARRNNGAFPFSQVASVIRHGGGYMEHTSRLMPAWGTFYGESVDPVFAKAMLFELTQYVESLQEK